MSVTIDTFGLTHVGKKRTTNEDQFLVASMGKTLELQQTSLSDVSRFSDLKQTEAWLLMVADGVGGLAGGELASGLAVETVGELVSQTAGCYQSFDVAQEHEFLDQLEGAVRRTHDAVKKMFGTKRQGPATTLTMVALAWPRAYIVHIGDTRAYYLHGERLRQITVDQTMAVLLVDEGVMTEEQAAKSSLDNVLSSAIGGEITPSIQLVDLDEKDRLLICSDGLTKHVTDDQIRDALMEPTDAKTACDTLVQAALEDGGTDNISVVIAQKGY